MHSATNSITILCGVHTHCRSLSIPVYARMSDYVWVLLGSIWYCSQGVFLGVRIRLPLGLSGRPLGCGFQLLSIHCSLAAWCHAPPNYIVHHVKMAVASRNEWMFSLFFFFLLTLYIVYGLSNRQYIYTRPASVYRIQMLGVLPGTKPAAMV